MQFKLNHATHKLYVAGYSNHNDFGIKVINTTSNSIIGGIALGRYAGTSNGFWPLGLDVDESPGPVGDKVYVVGQSETSANVALRVIDGLSNSSMTGEGTDLFVPVGVQEFASVTVNSSNHKLYVAKENGFIVVVDGPNLQIVRTFNPQFGSFLVASPATNKIFVLNDNGGGFINSADDTFAPLSLFFTATAAAVDSVHARIYFVGKTLNNNNGIFVVDAATGAIVGSRTDLAAPALSVALNPSDNRLYVGSASELLAFDAADLTPRGSFARPAAPLECDPTAPASLFFVDYHVANSILAMDPATGVAATVTLGYHPFDIAINSRTNRVYVTDPGIRDILLGGANQLLGIDGSNHTVVNRIPTIPMDDLPDGFNQHVAVSERLNRIYLPRRIISNSTVRWFVDVYDGGTGQLRGSIALDPTAGLYSDLVAIDDTRRRIYAVAAYQTGSMTYTMNLVVYDADTEARITTVALAYTFDFRSVGLAVNPVTGRVYVQTGLGGVAIVDGNTNTRVGAVSANGEFAINRRTNKIYVAYRNYNPNNQVSVINGATDSLETTFPIQNGQVNDSEVGLAVDEVANRVYLAHRPNGIPIGGRLTAYDANNGYQFLGQTDLALSPIRIGFNCATRQLFVSHDVDGLVTVFQDATAAPADLFGNISTRTYVADGDNVLVGGFIVGGSGSDTKRVLIRAVGPSLTQAGVAGALPDTTLEVHPMSGNVTTNDNWKINDATGLSQQAEIEATGLPPGNDLESALVMTLPAGQSGTAIVRGRNGASGFGLVEVYDLDPASPAKLLNISTRGHVGTGDNVMIAGVIILGSKSAQVVVRAIGPSLASSGLPNPLQDPLLELRDPNGGLIAVNDDWQEHEAEVNATTLAPTDPRESVIVATLFPANYTAIARGKNGSTGVALVEAYYLSQ
jgi:DNA-binding beta-propeller fold protein YncE